MHKMRLIALVAGYLSLAVHASAQTTVWGTVRDETGSALPGTTVELEGAGGPRLTTVSDSRGAYGFDGVGPGRYRIAFKLVNFATVRRDVTAPGMARVDAVLRLALNADVTVTGTRTFANLADVENPAEGLVGIAQSASQGAISAKQLAERPIMRQGEVLETVPGVIVTQHSGEGKANQYFLRGFNLDHGTDFALTVAGTPVNLPTHAHGQGYSDLNFLIPELVTSLQFSKGPYYADQGDFATAGSATINYATTLDKSIAHVEAGSEGYSRAVFAASPRAGPGHLLAALDMGHNNGPWTHPDDYRKVSAVLRYSQGDAVNGFSLTAMGYHGQWSSTDQVAQRAIASGLFDRFGAIDPSDGGHTHRYNAIADWQHGRRSGDGSTRITAYGVAYDLHLFSNFTYYLNDPKHGDQVEQADHRFIAGASVTHRRLAQWRGRPVQNIVGVQIRNDDITNVGLYHTQARIRLETRDQAAVLETTGGAYVQNEIGWAPWLRTMAGFRADASRSGVAALDMANSGSVTAGLLSPKGGATLGPWKGTELYVNAGTGFHSNDARGTTMTRDRDGDLLDRVTPLVRAKGAEVGVRTVAIPHVQSTASVWTLRLASELVFSGDDGTTVPKRTSARHGVEWTNYYSPMKWLVFDGDLSWSRARFAEFDPLGGYVPQAVGTVVSAGATLDGFHKASGSLRWRYFGPRALIEDNSVRSRATSLVNVQGGYQIVKNVKVGVDVFNLLNATDSDVDYFYVSRLRGEPVGGIGDVHTHPTPPRTARVSLVLAF